MRITTLARNEIILDKNRYDNTQDFIKDIGTLVYILTQNEYQCSITYEDVGIYVLGFDHDNPDMGTPMIHWLDREQEEKLNAEELPFED